MDFEPNMRLYWYDTSSWVELYTIITIKYIFKGYLGYFWTKDLKNNRKWYIRNEIVYTLGRALYNSKTFYQTKNHQEFSNPVGENSNKNFSVSQQI